MFGFKLIRTKQKLTRNKAFNKTIEAQFQRALRNINSQADNGLFETCLKKRELCDLSVFLLEERGFKVSIEQNKHYELEDFYLITWI